MSTESRIIARLIGTHAPPPPLGPGDDAALVPGGIAVSMDTMIEGVHFDARLSAADVGWKLVAVNASDIGACGREPDWALLSISLPRPLDEVWLESFADGLREALEHFGVRLLGGDTTASPGPRTATLTIASHPGGPFIARSTAQPGEDLWVSGTLGSAAAGFLCADPHGLSWLRRPHPPVALGAALGRSGLVTAMMDLSDGLSADLARLCDASGIGARIIPANLPWDPALRSGPMQLSLQVAFGEDYQLLFSAPPAHRDALRSLSKSHRIQLTCIGTTTRERERILSGESWPEADFAHFDPIGTG